MFDMNDILLFTKLVESKTLTGAADDLGLPKSTVSRRLSQLEDVLGVRLFERNTRHFSLTDVGLTYYTHCVEILARIHSANQEVTDMQVAPRGRIRLTAPTDLSSRYLGALLAAFTTRHPEIHVELVVTDRLVNLMEDAIDVALRIGNIAHSSNLVSHKIATTIGVLCASPRYLEEHGTPTKIEDLYGKSLALFMPNGMHSFTLTDGKTTHEIAPPARLVADHYAPIRDALVASAGIGVMCDYAVARELASGELVRVLPGWSSGTLDVRMVHPARAALPPRITLLLDHFMRNFAPPPWERELASVADANRAAS
jgi:DNA-binding transcriptional LysR family regulator